MTPLPLNSVFSLHGIRAMKEPGQNCLPDLFPESLWSFSLTLILKQFYFPLLRNLTYLFYYLAPCSFFKQVHLCHTLPFFYNLWTVSLEYGDSSFSLSWRNNCRSNLKAEFHNFMSFTPLITRKKRVWIAGWLFPTKKDGCTNEKTS